MPCLSLDSEMSKCYAVYQMQSFWYSDVRFGVGHITFLGGVGEFACGLGDLTDSQLEELKEELQNRVGEELEIRISENWNNYRNEHDIIFLIKVLILMMRMRSLWRIWKSSMNER